MRQSGQIHRFNPRGESPENGPDRCENPATAATTGGESVAGPPVWAVADLDCEFCGSCGAVLDGGRCPYSLAAVIERLEREFLPQRASVEATA